MILRLAGLNTLHIPFDRDRWSANWKLRIPLRGVAIERYKTYPSVCSKTISFQNTTTSRFRL
jgi:hypothetical protein